MGYPEITRYLIENVDFEMYDDRRENLGYSILHWSFFSMNRAVCQAIFRKYKAIGLLNIHDNNGFTPLSFAIIRIYAKCKHFYRGEGKIVSYIQDLILEGADVNAYNDEGHILKELVDYIKWGGWKDYITLFIELIEGGLDTSIISDDINGWVMTIGSGGCKTERIIHLLESMLTYSEGSNIDINYTEILRKAIANHESPVVEHLLEKEVSITSEEALESLRKGACNIKFDVLGPGENCYTPGVLLSNLRLLLDRKIIDKEIFNDEHELIANIFNRKDSSGYNFIFCILEMMDLLNEIVKLGSKLEYILPFICQKPNFLSKIFSMEVGKKLSNNCVLYALCKLEFIYNSLVGLDSFIYFYINRQANQLEEFLRVDGGFNDPVVKFFDNDFSVSKQAIFAVFENIDLLKLISGYLGYQEFEINEEEKQYLLGMSINRYVRVKEWDEIDNSQLQMIDVIAGKIGLEGSASALKLEARSTMADYLGSNAAAKESFDKDAEKFITLYELKKAAEFFNIEIKYYSEEDGVITFSPYNNKAASVNSLRIYVEADGTRFISLIDYSADDDMMIIEEEGGWEETKGETEDFSPASNKRTLEEDAPEAKKMKVSITGNEHDDHIIDLSNSILQKFALPRISSEYISSSINMVLELFENAIGVMEENSAEIANTLLDAVLDYDETHQDRRIPHYRPGGSDDDGDNGGGGSGSGAILGNPDEGFNGVLLGAMSSPSNHTQIYGDHNI